MSDKQLGIIVTGDIKDIEEKLSTLVDTINNIVDKSVDISVNVNDAGVEALQNDLSIIDNETIAPEVDSSALTDLSTNASIAATELVDAANSADALDQSINTIDSGAINEAASAASALGTEFSNASNEASSISSNMSIAGTDIAATSTAITGLTSSLGGFGGELNNAFNSLSQFTDQLGIAASTGELFAVALAAVVAIAIAAYLYEAAVAAGEFNDSWSRLGEAVDEGGLAIQNVQSEWTESINIMKEETGRSAGLIREHIISMGLAGVTSKDLIIQSFEGISGAAFVTGNSIDSIEQAFRRVVSTGILSTRQLMAFGLTTEDVFNATGMTMDQVREKFKSLDVEGRTALLNLILAQKYGETANLAYKNSWQHVTDAVQAAWTALSIAVGQLILPIVIPAVNLLTFALNGLATIINMITGYFGWLNSILGNTSVTLTALALIIPGFGPLLTPFAAAIGFIADNWGRLSTNVEKFFTMIKSGDWGAALELLVSELKWAFVDAPLSFIASLPAKVGELSGKFIEAGKNIINWIVSGLTSLQQWLDEQLASEFSNSGTSAAEGMVDGFGAWLDDNGWKIAEIVSDVLFQILPKLLDIALKIIGIVLKAVFDAFAEWAGNLPNSMYKWGKDAFQAFIDAIIDSIPGLRDALDLVKRLFPQSPPKTGPLADVTEANMEDYGESLGDAFAYGINRTTDSIFSNLGNLDVTSLSLSENTLKEVSNPMNVSEHNHKWDVQVKVDKLDVTSPEKTEESVQLLFNQFMEKLKTQYGIEFSQRGISLY